VCPIRIGREEEVTRLRAYAAARRTTFLVGPAGIGKSQLSAEAASIARAQGLGVLTGHCSPEQSVPYGPFVSAVRRRTRTLQPAEVEALFAGGASLCAALVPELAGTVAVPTSAPPQADLFASAWVLLARLAGQSGALLLLEDLHWADNDTLALLAYLVRESDDLPVWIVGTFRGDELHRRHPLTPVLAALARDRRYDQIDLRPLSRDELVLMLGAILEDPDVSDELGDALFARTLGNPFFTEELLKVLLERGDLRRDGGGRWVVSDLEGLELPDTVRETLIARTRTVEPEVAELLHLAALDADRIDLGVLAVAAGTNLEGVESAVAEGLRLQLLVEHPDAGVPAYEFRHALTREALAEEMIGPDRRRGHLALARAVEQVHGDNLDVYAAALADHFAAGGDADGAISWGRRAAAIAAASYAMDEAGRRYEQVLARMRPDDPERLRTLLDAAAATAEARDGRMCRAFAGEARSLARERGERLAEAAALQTLALTESDAGNTVRAVALLEEALALVEGRDDRSEATVLSSLCRQLTRADRIDAAVALTGRARAAAERAGDTRSLASLHVTSMMNASSPEEMSAALSAARDAASASGDERAQLSLEQTAGYVSLWRGEFTQSAACFERALGHVERVAPHDRYTAAGYVWLLSLSGAYDRAMQLAAQPLASSAVPTRIVALTGLYEIAERRGADEAAEELEELWSASAKTGESQRSVPALSARARLRALTEGVDAAAGEFWDVLAMTTSARGRGSHWLFSPDFAMGLVAAERVEELERWATEVGAVTASDPHHHNRAADALVRGLCALGLADFAAAGRALGEALALYDEMPCPARVVETHLALADLARRVGDDGAAQSSAAAALRVAQSLDAGALIKRAGDAVDRAATRSIVATILFTDIVGSTERLSEVGDRSWGALLDRHDAVVRRELGDHAGREVNTTGDGFVAAFDSPARAVRCARDLRDALRAVGIEIHTGIHTGECQEVDGDLRGLAVHLAARVCAAAAASEVLVTSTVRELVVGSELRFSERGARELKGVPGTWVLYALDDGVPGA